MLPRDPKKHWVLHGGEPVDPKKILPELARHDAVLQNADVVHNSEAGTPHAIAWELLSALGLD